MASNTTTTTPNIHLSQYAANDVTSYLTNYNSDMLAIDTAVGELQAKETDITQLQSRMTTAEQNITNNTDSIESLETDYGSLVEKTNTLETQLGTVSGTASQALQTANSASQTAAQNTLDINQLKNSAMQYTTLWQNPNPDVALTGTVTLSDSFTNYKLIIYLYRLDASFSTSSTMLIHPNNTTNRIFSTSSNVLCFRDVTITDQTTVNVGHAQTINTYGSAGAETDTKLVLTAIGGLK